jgi:hypothetical protein
MWRTTVFKSMSFATSALVSKQVVAYISDNLSQFEGLFFDELGPLKRSGAELIQLH